MVLELLAVAIWLMLPAYIPNNVAALAGGGRPIDGGRTWDERRLLGDGKTWRGATVGTAAGTALALLLNWLEPTVSAAIGIDLPVFASAAIVSLPLGAMLGDIGASFAKRRTGRRRGAMMPGVDQLDFVVGALVLTAILAFEWFLAEFTLPIVLVVLVVTPILHVTTNVLAYLVGVKPEPW